jgi:hypothetical protein
MKLIKQCILDSVNSELILAGPAALALQEVSGVLVSLTALLEEGGSLQQSPDNVKAMARDAIAKCKELADNLANSIGVGFPKKEKEKAPEGKPKKKE